MDGGPHGKEWRPTAAKLHGEGYSIIISRKIACRKLNVISALTRYGANPDLELFLLALFSLISLVSYGVFGISACCWVTALSCSMLN